jgi:hypothetical protein
VRSRDDDGLSERGASSSRVARDVKTSVSCSVTHSAADIRKERYRFNYDRKWILDRMKQATIRLPAISHSDGSFEPDFASMRNYIESLPFSSVFSAGNSKATLGYSATKPE